jgi:hypothetical protein
MRGPASFVCFVFGATVFEERPLDRVLYEAVLEGCSGMIEDQSVELATLRVGAKHAADHLAIQPQALSRARQHKARHAWLIPSLGQHHTVDDDIDRAYSQLHQDAIALLERSRSVEMLGPYTEPTEFVPKMDGVRYVHREDDCGATLTQAEPMFDHVADQLCGVHASGKLALNVVAVSDVNAGKVRLHGCENLGRDQILACNQLSHRRALDQYLENITETAAIASAGCRGQTENDCVRIGGEQTPVCHCSCMMGFINQHKVGWRQLYGTRPHCAGMQRLN